MTPLVIFGTGSFGQVARAYFERDTDFRVVGFTATAEQIRAPQFDGLPLVPYETIEQRFPPSGHQMFVAVGYRRVNTIRAAFYADAKSRGYALATYVSPRCSRWENVSIGDNTFIFEDNTIQPFVTIGSDVVLWSGNHIGHHSTIGDHCFLASHVVISGHVTVGPRCFFGVNATTRDAISIGEGCIIGAGALIMKPTQPGEVYVAERTRPHRRSADQMDF